MIVSRTMVVALLVAGFVYSCTCQQEGSQQLSEQTKEVLEDMQAVKLNELTVGSILTPEGFIRLPFSENSFVNYLRSFPLDTIDHVVHLYNGEEKSIQGIHYAILDVDVGKRDLQQCADAVMRLYGEYLFASDRKDEISFHFTSGDEALYSMYAQGYRPNVNGSSVSWHQIRPEDDSYNTFRNYMNLVFTYAGSYSLSKQLVRVEDFTSILPGDVLIQGGFPGHAVIVVDVAVRPDDGQKVFMIAQSYMPAQDIHILLNPTDMSTPWYEIPEGETISTPQWSFIKENLMRFSDK